MPVFTVPQGPPDGPTGPDGPASPLQDYGGIYWQGSRVAAPAPPQGLVVGLWNKLLNATGNMPSSAGVTPDFANNQVVIVTPGNYDVFFACSHVYPPFGNIQFSVFLNGIQVQQIWECIYTISTLPPCASAQGLVALAAGDVLDVRANPNGTNNINFDCGQLYVERADP